MVFKDSTKGVFFKGGGVASSANIKKALMEKTAFIRV
jgi:hypothetical protein